MESLPKEYVRSYLLSWFHYSSAKITYSKEVYERAFYWIRQLSGLGYVQIPFSVIIDLGFLLSLGAQYKPLSEFEFDPYEKKVRLHYQFAFLNPFWQNPDFQKVSEWVQFSPQREDLIVRALEILLFDIRDHFHSPIWVNPIDLRAQMKNFSLLSPAEELKKFQEWRNHKDEFFLGEIERFVSTFVPKKKWFEEEDLYELEHYHIFQTSSSRVLGRQIKKLQKLFPPWSLSLEKRRETEEIETEHTDEGYYPTGGLSELTNRGSLENLVFSELVFIEENQPFDLFDIRYVEQELLFFMRDSGQLRRKRRCLNIILKQDPSFDITYPQHQYKVSSLLCGFLLQLLSDVQSLFESESFIVKIFIDETRSEIQENLRLLKLFLKNEIEQNRVLFSDPLPLQPKTFSPEALIDRKRKVHTLYLSAEPAPEYLNLQKKELQLLSVLIRDFEKKPLKNQLILDLGEEMVEQLLSVRDQILRQILLSR